MELTLKNLYTQTLSIELEIITLQDDLKELKSEFTYDKDTNTSGFAKDEVARVLKAAKATAKEDDLVGKAEELTEIVNLQEQFDS